VATTTPSPGTWKDIPGNPLPPPPLVAYPKAAPAAERAEVLLWHAGHHRGHPHKKDHQEEYWGSPEWVLSWNRRTYVERVFAAVVAYNLRQLENQHAPASKHCPDNPLLRAYAQHPLHQPTNWAHGFTMLTEEQRAQWERDWQAEIIASNGDDADHPAPA
jgi:hypothetical protein